MRFYASKYINPLLFLLSVIFFTHLVFPGCQNQYGEDRRYTTPSTRKPSRPECQRYSEPLPFLSSRHYNKEYEFSSDWFTPHIPVWKRVLRPLIGKPNIRYLEIGVYEGRAALWILENILTHPTAELVGIDIFPGDLKQRYINNLRKSGYYDKTTTITGFSQIELRKLAPESFDIIYIDGSHTADDVLADAVLSWYLLKEGGFIVFDDYEWRKGTHLPDELRPRFAIDSFITAYRNYLNVVHRCYQLIITKRSNPCPRKEHCSPFGRYIYDWKEHALFSSKDKKRRELEKVETQMIEKLLRAKPFGGVKIDIEEKTRKDQRFRSLINKTQIEI